MVIGGQAVLVYGEPRLTRDIDITLGAALDRLAEMVALTEDIGLEVLVNPVEFTPKTLVLPCRDRETGVRVDFIFSWSLYEKQALERSRGVSILGTKVKFAALEDVVIHKIVAGRPRDLEDVRLLLLKNPTYDSIYIKKWLQEFDEALGEDFAGRLQQVLSEAISQ